jgi:hypothetical protein
VKPVSGNNQDNLADKASFPQSLASRARASSIRADREGRGRNEMEKTMTAQQITRRLDRSIGIDFYRQKGLMERRAVMTDFFRGLVRARKALIAVAVIAAALYVSPARDGTGWNGPSAPGNGSTNASLRNPVSVPRWTGQGVAGISAANASLPR